MGGSNYPVAGPFRVSFQIYIFFEMGNGVVNIFVLFNFSFHFWCNKKFFSDKTLVVLGWWDETVAYIEAQLVDEVPSKIKIVEDLKYLKEILLLFSQTAESLSLPSPKLTHSAFNLRHSFVNKLNDAFSRRFVTILWKEVYAPIVVNSSAKLKEIRKIFPIDYIEVARGKCEVGRTLPFSESVPKIYFTLKEFVTELQNFCSGYQFNPQVIINQTRKCEGLTASGVFFPHEIRLLK